MTIQMSLFRSSIKLFFWVLIAWLCFNPCYSEYQYVCSTKLVWDFNSFGICYGFFGVDGISLFFILLTTFFIPLCMLYSWKSSSPYITDYFICFFCIEILLVLVFSVMDLFFFYVFFEAILIPFFFIIGLHGSRDRKLHASYLLFFYTLVGSLIMLTSIFSVYLHTGTTNFAILWGAEFSLVRESLLWWTFFFSFAIKVPMLPFHIWLPEAHVESPTEGSVILAAILLKVGGYGFLRILLPIFPTATVYYSSIVVLLCVVSIIYTSMSTLRQTDIKRIIAYSSIAHMNVAILGVMMLTHISIVGSLLLMFGHGIVSGGLFLLVGVLYDRFRTKVITYYSGVVHTMPVFSCVFFLFVLGNISMPCTANFIGEFLVLLSTFEHVNLLCVFAISLSIFSCAFYSLYVYNRITFGMPLRIQCGNDLTILEFSVFFPILFFLFFLGIYPKPFIDIITPSCMCVSIHFFKYV